MGGRGTNFQSGAGRGTNVQGTAAAGDGTGISSGMSKANADEIKNLPTNFSEMDDDTLAAAHRAWRQAAHDAMVRTQHALDEGDRSGAQALNREYDRILDMEVQAGAEQSNRQWQRWERSATARQMRQAQQAQQTQRQRQQSGRHTKSDVMALARQKGYTRAQVEGHRKDLGTEPEYGGKAPSWAHVYDLIANDDFY